MQMQPHHADGHTLCYEHAFTYATLAIQAASTIGNAWKYMVVLKMHSNTSALDLYANHVYILIYILPHVIIYDCVQLYQLVCNLINSGR